MARFLAAPATCLFALLLLTLSTTPARAQSFIESLSIDGITVGGGLALFQGDLDANPSHNPLRLIGNGNVHLLIGIDHEREPYRFGVELVYDRLTGSMPSPDYQFTNNALSLDLVAHYNAAFIRDGLIGGYVGIGPTLLFNPQYTPHMQQRSGQDSRYRTKGSRVMLTFKGGFDFNDQIRIGLRLFLSDYVDGYAGFTEDSAIDMVSSITLGYRFDL